MKKLLLFLFSISIFLFDFEISSEDNSYLINNPDSYGFYILNEEISYEKLKEFFEDSSLSLISIKPSNMDFYVRLEGNDITSILESGNKKIIDVLGYDEDSIKYMVGNYSVDSIKIYGKNAEIYKLLEDIHKE